MVCILTITDVISLHKEQQAKKLNKAEAGNERQLSVFVRKYGTYISL
jgi:hypothetical protein